MKRYIHESEDIFAMSNVLGKFIKVEDNVPFSFYYSVRNSSHGPRVKVIMNPEKVRLSRAGTLKLCDDWEFVPGESDKYASNRDIKLMKAFFKRYLILFLLVWDDLADDPMLGLYLENRASLHEFIETLDFYDEYSEELDKIEIIKDLEQFCRNNNLVNFYGN